MPRMAIMVTQFVNKWGMTPCITLKYKWMAWLLQEVTICFSPSLLLVPSLSLALLRLLTKNVSSDNSKVVNLRVGILEMALPIPELKHLNSGMPKFQTENHLWENITAIDHLRTERDQHPLIDKWTNTQLKKKKRQYHQQTENAILNPPAYQTPIP